MLTGNAREVAGRDIFVSDFRVCNAEIPSLMQQTASLKMLERQSNLGWEYCGNISRRGTCRIFLEMNKYTVY